jgi:hypothetical protein
MREVRTGPDGLYHETACVHLGAGTAFAEVKQVTAETVRKLTAAKLRSLLRDGPWSVPYSGKKKEEMLAMVLALLDESPPPPPAAAAAS